MRPALFSRRDWLSLAGSSLASLSLGASAGFSAEPGSARTFADVPWLREVTVFDQDRLAAAAVGAEAPAPLAVGDLGSVGAWQAARRKLIADWETFLGPVPPSGTTEVKVLSEESLKGHIRRKLRWDVEPDVGIDAWLLIPHGTPPKGGWPAVVALHQTTNRTIDEIAGVGTEGDQARGVALAERGFVTLCPKNFLWQDVAKYDEAVRRWNVRQPKSRGMRKMLVDATRSVDYLLAANLGINPRRIGCFGHSLGAKEVLYLMAFDERVAAGVASDGGVPYASTNWNAPWYLQDGFDKHAKAAGLAHHQLLALAAPRPLLIVAGGEAKGGADGERTLPLVAAAAPAYQVGNVPSRLGLWNHGEGHSLSNRVWSRCLEWLTAYV